MGADEVIDPTTEDVKTRARDFNGSNGDGIRGQVVVDRRKAEDHVAERFDEVVLACFSFAGEAIYRDLLDHGDLAAAHPAVRAGGAGTGPGLLRSTDGISWDALDYPAEPVTGRWAAVGLDRNPRPPSVVSALLG